VRGAPAEGAHRSSTDTDFWSDADAPAASVTVTVIVKLRGRTMMYVCPALYVPWLGTLPVDVFPSPQSILYDHGPLLFASLKLQLNDQSRPVTAWSSGPAFTTGGELGDVQVTEYVMLVVWPEVIVTGRDVPPLTLQFVATPDRVAV